MRIRLPWSRRPEADCREVARKLQLVLDGEAAESDATRIESHLEACRRCGLEADVYRRLKAALAGPAPTSDPEALARLRAFANNLTNPDP